ncbi:hypothetical protein N5V81_13190 [Escherichia coli]|nr:hypothetical protein [Escherichia coli]
MKVIYRITPDQLLVFLYSDKAKQIKGIFERKTTSLSTLLSCICCGVSELDPNLFANYLAQSPRLLEVKYPPDIRISKTVPTVLRLQDVSGSSDDGEQRHLSSSESELATESFLSVEVDGLKQDIIVYNLGGVPIEPILHFFESQTCHLVESLTYHFKGAL